MCTPCFHEFQPRYHTVVPKKVKVARGVKVVANHMNTSVKVVLPEIPVGKRYVCDVCVKCGKVVHLYGSW